MRSGLSYIFVVTLALTMSCRQIVDFDGEAKATPTLPFIAEPEYAQRCEACALEHCATERDACVDDAQCLTLLRCHGGCSNALCRAQCGSFDFRDDTSAPTGNNPQGSESPLLTAYLGCIGSFTCARECNTGRNWECLEDRSYRWPGEAETVNVRDGRLRIELVSFLAEQGIPARVTAYYGDQSSPRVVNARADTDAWGQAELDLGGSFFGVFEIESSARGVFQNLVHTQPIIRPTRWATVVVPEGVLPIAAGAAAVWVSIKDCLGFDAPGISFELSQGVGQPGYYLVDVGFSSDASETDEYGIGGLVDVPADRRKLTVVAKRQGTIVAHRNVIVAPDWISIAHLEPRGAE